MKIITILLLFVTTAIHAQDRYEYRGGDPNGINKWYMGRQIAHVMSHFGIDWLERPEREQEENTTQLITNLNLRPTSVVADIGAGSGYHSTLMAKKLTRGKVYAVDVEPEMIKYLQNRIREQKLNNVEPVLGTEQEVKLPPASIDVMLLVDVYHEFSYPYEMSLSMLKALKPGGKLYLVEFRAEDRSVPIKTVHKMSETQARKELTAAGFKFEQNISNLPWQHCLVFSKPKE